MIAVTVFFLIVVWIAVRTLSTVNDWKSYYAPYDTTSAASAMKAMPSAFKTAEFNYPKEDGENA